MIVGIETGFFAEFVTLVYGALLGREPAERNSGPVVDISHQDSFSRESERAVAQTGPPRHKIEAGGAEEFYEFFEKTDLPVGRRASGC